MAQIFIHTQPGDKTRPADSEQETPALQWFATGSPAKPRPFLEVLPWIQSEAGSPVQLAAYPSFSVCFSPSPPPVNVRKYINYSGAFLQLNFLKLRHRCTKNCSLWSKKLSASCMPGWPPQSYSRHCSHPDIRGKESSGIFSMISVFLANSNVAAQFFICNRRFSVIC